MVVARVCDNGEGIPESFREKIFEPFFTTKKVGQGTGLGLSISYNILKEFGAGIEAADNANQGACFVLRFPTTGSDPNGSMQPLPDPENSTATNGS